MDARYELLKNANLRSIKEYNSKVSEEEQLAYIVVIIDEFADLIMSEDKGIETPLARLAQLSRAIGIHLIIATQRPSVNIITGTIKANFSSRIAFRTTSKIDSRTILDTSDADKLIGRGDALYSSGYELVRLQCAFPETKEIEKVCDFIASQDVSSEPFLLPAIIKGEHENTQSEYHLITTDLFKRLKTIGQHYSFDLFDDYRDYMQPRRLFVLLFNAIPSIHIVKNANYHQVIKWIEDKMAEDIISKHVKIFHGDKESMIGQDVTIYVLKNNILVCTDDTGELNILFTENETERAKILLDELMKF